MPDTLNSKDIPNQSTKWDTLAKPENAETVIEAAEAIDDIAEKAVDFCVILYLRDKTIVFHRSHGLFLIRGMSQAGEPLP